MITDDDITRELDALIDEVPALIELARQDEAIIKFGDSYQVWYSRATKIVELLGAERLSEFCSYYRIDPKRKQFEHSTYVIQDYVNGVGASTLSGRPRWDVHTTVAIRVVNQSQIVKSLKGRIGTVLTDVKGHLLANIEDEELKVAQKLLRVNLRAAGAITGVILESHLQRVASNHRLVIKKKEPAISDLNDPLRAADVYDLPTWRKIQHLADIRNLCDHKKDREPTEEEVAEMIAGTNSIVRTLF